MNLSELCENLLEAKKSISAESIGKELSALLPANELLGLDLKIRVALEQLVCSLSAPAMCRVNAEAEESKE